MHFSELRSVTFQKDDFVDSGDNHPIINEVGLFLNVHICWRISVIDFDNTPVYKFFALIRREDRTCFDGHITITKENNLYRFDIANEDNHGSVIYNFFIDENRFKRFVKNIS